MLRQDPSVPRNGSTARRRQGILLPPKNRPPASIQPESTISTQAKYQKAHRDGPTQRSLDAERQHVPSSMVQSLHGKGLGRERARRVRAAKRSVRLGFGDVVTGSCLCQRIELCMRRERKRILRSSQFRRTPRRSFQGPSHPNAVKLAYTIPWARLRDFFNAEPLAWQPTWSIRLEEYVRVLHEGGERLPVRRIVQVELGSPLSPRSIHVQVRERRKFGRRNPQDVRAMSYDAA